MGKGWLIGTKLQLNSKRNSEVLLPSRVTVIMMMYCVLQKKKNRKKDIECFYNKEMITV
jgi:hypothetical protein